MGGLQKFLNNKKTEATRCRRPDNVWILKSTIIVGVINKGDSSRPSLCLLAINNDDISILRGFVLPLISCCTVSVPATPPPRPPTDWPRIIADRHQFRIDRLKISTPRWQSPAQKPAFSAPVVFIDCRLARVDLLLPGRVGGFRLIDRLSGCLEIRGFN